MDLSQERLLLIVDQLEDCYLEQLALRTVLINHEESLLPSWPEVQLLVAEAKRSSLERGLDLQKPFAVLRQRISEEPNLERAIQTILASLPTSQNPH